MAQRPPLLRDTDAAKLLGCSRSTIWRWVKEGAFPKPLRIGDSARWTVDDVESVINAAVQARNS